MLFQARFSKHCEFLQTLHKAGAMATCLPTLKQRVFILKHCQAGRPHQHQRITAQWDCTADTTVVAAPLMLTQNIATTLQDSHTFRKSCSLSAQPCTAQSDNTACHHASQLTGTQLMETSGLSYLLLNKIIIIILKTHNNRTKPSRPLANEHQNK